MTAPRILIAGLGHLFMGDDAFGCQVARQLTQRPLPDSVRVVDFGIHALDLTYALLDPYDAVILVDAAPRGQAPGTLYLIEPTAPPEQQAILDAHSMDPVKILQAAAAMGGPAQRLLIVACEPTPRDPDADWEMSLSPPVQAAVPEAMVMIESLVAQTLNAQPPGGAPLKGDPHHESLEPDSISVPHRVL